MSSFIQRNGSRNLFNFFCCFFVDDEPKTGPQHYIFISGFRKPQLLQILEELGIYVNGVVKIQSESYETLKNLENEKLAEEELDGNLRLVLVK